MFTIRDGRECFYAWDLDRQVIVSDPSIVEVHFCNRTDDCSLVVEVKEENGIRVANVPNIILQSSFDIRVFGYDGKATLHEETFKVKPRTRPADYVYTETEILSVQELAYKYVQEAITNNAELLDTVTVDVSSCTKDTATTLAITDDLERFIQSIISGKDVLAFLKVNDIVFSATTNVRNLSKQYQIHLQGTPYFTHGTETSSLGTSSFRYTVQIIVNKESGYTSCYGFRYPITEFATEEYVDNAFDALYDVAVIYRLVKPDSEPTPDSMDGNKVLITDSHTIEYLNRVFAGEAVLGYTWKMGLSCYLITDFVKAASRLTLKAHRLSSSAIYHYIFYIDKEADGNWYWAGYQYDEYDIQKATEDAIKTAFDDVVTAEGGAY